MKYETPELEIIVFTDEEIRTNEIETSDEPFVSQFTDKAVQRIAEC